MGVLRGRTAVVTGGSRGIGRGIVERLAADGAEVVFNYVRDREAAEEVVREVKAAGGGARAVRLDLAEPGAAEELMRTASEGSAAGEVSVLVNNAAIGFSPTPLDETGEELFDRAMAVNAKAAFLTVRYAARFMPEDGRIVNISTLNTVRPGRGIVPYMMSKGALEQLTAAAAMELGPRRITVNTVSPGATDTDLLRGTNPPEALEMAVGLTPLGRLGEPADVAAVVAFLVGPDGAWITGQNLRATGGLG
ncbi:SDR family oxidoreductase [Streptomyces sp. TRM76323]|uniref:SDR family oxidoreductase n=1 Tax=Streptomyces tamarix TaxID=3078565 RepID=A0ABU3QHB4_9ACTN|nr:SDR family oxidoreductase [Streptomyces tamarix]MDT9682155.1 SDR family oxidoreductase [Streptomyces tamarix]